MERWLRELIRQQPDEHHALNALGYALADRNLRLDEAQQLIAQALEMVPGDPFVTDSMGWVLYRKGQLREALVLLQDAWDSRADVEIAAHLGEVLWQLGERVQAREVWAQGKALQADHAKLVETMQRLDAAR
jgi:Flp pilus assembly protein TadD